MQHLQELLNSTEAPLVYAFILGLLTAVSPCQFARNITAIGYISRDIQNPGKVFVNGLFYTFGNAAGYLSIGIILFLGASTFSISRALISISNILIGIVLLAGGILMLDIIKIRFPEGNRLISWIQERRFRGNRSDSALLGFILSLSFCPYNAALFFGMLIPMTISSIKGLYLPVVYSITTGLPVCNCLPSGFQCFKHRTLQQDQDFRGVVQQDCRNCYNNQASIISLSVSVFFCG